MKKVHQSIMVIVCFTTAGALYGYGMGEVKGACTIAAIALALSTLFAMGINSKN